MLSKKIWNGEYYVSFGPQKFRCWDEARKYGFVSAGGGHWYIRTLRFLDRDCRIWVNVPGHGYVGVGIVEEPMVKADHFLVKTPNRRKLPITQIPSLKTRLDRL